MRMLLKRQQVIIKQNATEKRDKVIVKEAMQRGQRLVTRPAGQ